MRTRGGLTYFVTGVLSGYAAFFMMMQTVNGGPWSWSGPVMLASAILLTFAGGVHTLAPRLAGGWIAAISASAPLAICSAFGAWPPRCWIFAGVVGGVAWAMLKVDAIIDRGDIAAFSASLSLAGCLAAISIATVRTYIAARSPYASPLALVALVFYWLIIVGSLVHATLTVLRSRRGDRGEPRRMEVAQ